MSSPPPGRLPAGRYTAARRSRRRGMPWRTPKEKWRIVAISAAAISAVYGIGYAVTDSPTGTGANVARSGAVRLSLSLPDAPRAGARLFDGVYPGTATNEFGTIAVEVTIARGRISTVRITRCSTFFPESYVAGLPGKVISTQATNLAVVSGATGSWQDFVAATRFALTAATRPRQAG